EYRFLHTHASQIAAISSIVNFGFGCCNSFTFFTVAASSASVSAEGNSVRKSPGHQTVTAQLRPRRLSDLKIETRGNLSFRFSPPLNS
ncbi:uncharacterized protein V6R79_008282, partial [Siganus canaliculatus]